MVSTPDKCVYVADQVEDPVLQIFIQVLTFYILQGRDVLEVSVDDSRLGFDRAGPMHSLHLRRHSLICIDVNTVANEEVEE